MRALLDRWLPSPTTASRREQLRAAGGALFGLLLTALLGQSMAPGALFLVAPIGASSVLLFALPASPLAQPWSAIGGNVVSGLMGVLCVRWFGDVLSTPLLCALAASTAIAAMFALRCLHPPGGAVALTAVIGGPAIHAAGFAFPLVTVLVDTTLLAVMAMLYNNLTGRRYPHAQQGAHPNPHATRDAVPTVRLGFKPEDLDAVLKQYNQVLDISRDELESLFMQTEQRAYQRRFGIISCADIMSRDIISAEFGTSLEEAWQQMRAHRVAALPVLNRARRVIGIVTQTDFLEHGGLDDYRSIRHQLQRFLRKSGVTHTEKAEVVGQIMTQHPTTARLDTPIVDLVPLMADSGFHHIPIVDHEQRFAGIITQSDLVAALYESRFAEAAA
ncbi:HPP family protein [Duganella sp. BJB488]|uniref:HPP family protein n=1 Tax=unclassified Duganella TaxID=2636909 RepID=UPI000E3429F9|nr:MULTISPECIES: HPP family protein [unclassified Duganella]RFP24093.1 HPP family protein [Duganella sp. BJB489]RFP26455.1 HPP family protein [Duganella sp. BJB488]RFP34814.1 HPP family protein [Duganella sp. BJB480]